MLTGTANLSGTGNELDNTITGNNGNNILTGAAGNDALDGALGNDTYVYTSATGPTRSRTPAARTFWSWGQVLR